MTVSERLLWEQLRDGRHGGRRWHRQTASGTFIFDFYCPSAKVVLEVDGGSHLSLGQQARDQDKNEYCACRGLQMVRVSATTVENDLATVLARLDKVCARLEDL